MVATTLLMVTSADIIRERDLFLGVDISAETVFLMTGRTTVPASNPYVGLEYESVITHFVAIKRLGCCSSCSFRSLMIETA